MIVTIFGDARVLPGSEQYEIAYQLGKEIARNGFTVCNGGYGGIMEASAKGAKESGGKTIGVTTHIFTRQHNPFMDEIVVKNSLIERMLGLIELGDAYIVLRGGTGTLLEFSAVWELIHKRLMEERPIILLGNFWKPVVDLFEGDVGFFGEGKISQFITIVSSIEDCAVFLAKHCNQHR